MPFATKGEFAATVTDWLARPDLASRVADFTLLAEEDIEQEFGLTFQDATASGNLDGSGELDLPADALYLSRFSIDCTPPRDLAIISPDQLNNIRFQGQGTIPEFAYHRGGKIIYAATADAGSPYSADYVRALARLGDQGDAGSTALLQHYRGLLLYATLVHTSGFLKVDPAKWASYYARAAAGVRRLETRRRTGGLVLRMKPASYS